MCRLFSVASGSGDGGSLHHNCRTHAPDLGVSPGDIRPFSQVSKTVLSMSLIVHSYQILGVAGLTSNCWASLGAFSSRVGCRSPALCGSAMRTRKQTLQEKPRLHSPPKEALAGLSHLLAQGRPRGAGRCRGEVRALPRRSDTAPAQTAGTKPSVRRRPRPTRPAAPVL